MSGESRLWFGSNFDLGGESELSEVWIWMDNQTINLYVSIHAQHQIFIVIVTAMDQNDSLARSSMKGSSDYSCVSSVKDKDVGESKAPGVVAKLMVLDSLPISNFLEAHSTSFLDCQSIRNARYHLIVYQTIFFLHQISKLILLIGSVTFEFLFVV